MSRVAVFFYIITINGKKCENLIGHIANCPLKSNEINIVPPSSVYLFELHIPLSILILVQMI